MPLVGALYFLIGVSAGFSVGNLAVGAVIALLLPLCAWVVSQGGAVFAALLSVCVVGAVVRLLCLLLSLRT
jgi:hypothetical protein